MTLRAILAALALCALVFHSAPAKAVGDPTCQNSELFTGKLITDICWGCIFPIKVAGIPLGKAGHVPDGATKKSLCLCFDKLGMPEPGLSIAMWQPARMVEVVRKPGCSMALGGITLPLGDRRLQGTKGHAELDYGDVVFYNYHTYAFPLLVMLDLFVDKNCVSDGYYDFDLVMLSEVDPTWNNAELSFFTQPEAAAVANPIAQSACIADAVAATVGKPIDQMFWCVGTWGSSLYPFVGMHQAAESMVANTNLLAARAVAVSHRRGLSWRTMGDDAMCKGKIDPMFPKSQYRWSLFFPLPEARDNHVTGESAYKWGMGKEIPAVGEDTLYILWRWTDCCSSFTKVGG